MTWETDADLSLNALKALREELTERLKWIEEFIGWELDLDELKGQIDALSDEIGRRERDAHEEKASENLVVIGRHYNMSEF